MLLDKSHLELVEDILKEIKFNDEDWKQLLGRELSGYIGLEYGYPGNLKECLREWLSRDTSDDIFSIWIYAGPPTLDDLADALKRISYSEAGEYIIKTCKLIIMFNDQCY